MDQIVIITHNNLIEGMDLITRPIGDQITEDINLFKIFVFNNFDNYTQDLSIVKSLE